MERWWSAGHRSGSIRFEGNRVEEKKPTAVPGRPGPTVPDLDVLEGECDVEFVRAGGPGGQHRNKVETGVRMLHRPTGIRVTATERRSQSQNRRAALERLREILVERARPVKLRRPTRKPRGVRQGELDDKRRRARTKALRGRTDARQLD